MAGDLEGAEKAALWYKNLFGEDYYLEVMRHPAADPKQRAEIYDNQQRCIQEKSNSQETEYQTYRHQRRAFSQ